MDLLNGSDSDSDSDYSHGDPWAFDDGDDSDYSFAFSLDRRIREDDPIEERRRNFSHRDDSDEERSESSDEDEEYLTFNNMMQRVQQNAPLRTLDGYGHDERVQNMTDLDWYWLGSDISNSTHLENVSLLGALNDHKMSFFFRGLTRSTSIKKADYSNNGFSLAGVRSMVPFLQNSDSLNKLHLDGNNIQSEGINLLFRALRDSPIEHLSCNKCGIESIEIDNDYFPKHLKSLYLYGNSINVDGCRELAKLLQGRDATLKTLWLCKNKIDDEAVAILVHALQSNTSLKELDLRNKVGDNEGITLEGMKLCLRLVNDITSIKATMQSNRTLQKLKIRIRKYERIGNELLDTDEKVIQGGIDDAVAINRKNENDPEAAGKEKVIQAQLHSGRRAELAALQGVDDRSLYSELNPLHLPEVLALVGQHHGRGELYAALKSSIVILFSTVNREECVKQQMEYHTAIIKEHESKLKALQAELATIKGEEIESRSIKRPRTEN
jgi:hypothetical protein